MSADNHINDALRRIELKGENYRKVGGDPKRIVDMADKYLDRSDHIRSLLCQAPKDSKINTMAGYAVGTSFVRSKHSMLKKMAVDARTDLKELREWLTNKQGYANAIAFEFGMVTLPQSHKISEECGSTLVTLHEDIERVTSQFPSNEQPEWRVRLVESSDKPSKWLSRLCSDPYRQTPKPPTNMIVRGMRPQNLNNQDSQTLPPVWRLLIIDTIQPPAEDSKKGAKSKEDADTQKEADKQKDTTAEKDAAKKQATDAKTGANSKRLDNVPEIVTFTESARPDSWRKQVGPQEAYPVGKHKPEYAEWLHVLYLVTGVPLKKSKVNLAEKIRSSKRKEDELLNLRFEMASMVALFFVTGHDLMDKVQAWPSLKDLVFIVEGDLDEEAQQWQERRLELDVCWEHDFGKYTPFMIASMSMRTVAARHRIALEIGILHAIMTGTATGIAANTTPAGIEAMKLELSKSLQAEKTSIGTQSLLGYDASIRKMFNRCLTWTGSPVDDPDGLQSELEAKQHILEGLRFAWDFWQQ